ncbi:MAG TPA: NADH-quinone oxidoreductase subunit J [Polyangia bacterium]|nr:NADH-quinone oxidoreductase subunit J [Polyangia bacterium]
MLLAPVTAQLVADGDVSTWTGPRVAFWIIGAIVVLGALFTITRKNAVAAVMSLVATFFGLAASYALLSAHFLAALQVLVYAGAIMVLFIFVVMVLNRDEPDRVAWNGVLVKAFIGVPAIVYLVWTLSFYLRQVVPAHPEAPPESFGTVAEVGNLLFTDYLFAFEAVSLLLLIAVIAAVVVARAHKTPDAPPPPVEERHA